MDGELISLSAQAEEQSIVVVDDAPDNLRLLIRILTDRGYKVRPAPNGSRALATIWKDPPDLVLLDIMMSGLNGYEVCRQLKSDDRTKDIPVIFLSALSEVIDKVKAFDAGGVDYISKPFQPEEVLARVNLHMTMRTQQKAIAMQNEELIRKNALITQQAKKLHKLATKDSLTGLSNRRDFLEKAAQEEKRFKRTQNKFSFILLDIDFFKRVNDTHGHECGDTVLKGTARCLENTLREQDTVARWGGEEFVCLLPETGTAGVRKVAEKMRRAVETTKHPCGKVSVTITATIGVSVYDGSCSIEACIRHADNALYRGKKLGRNQVVESEGKE